MSKWIAEFDLEDGDTMPEHMDLEYMGAKIDFHCRPMWTPCNEETGDGYPEDKRWSGLWSEPQDDNSMYGEKLIEGDTIYLMGVEGTVTQECGSWGWGSPRYVPWEQLESKIPHNNSPYFCYCDNFVSFWELKWNFDDGYDWDGVPYISHKADKEGQDD